MTKLFMILAIVLSDKVVAFPPVSWQFGFPTPATEIMEVVVRSHSFTMGVMIIIMLLVWVLIAYSVFRFRKSKVGNNISKVEQNILLETIWFILPTVVAGILAFKNAKLIRLQEKMPKTDMTLKVVGHQWYWSYQYPEYQELSFDSYIKDKVDFIEGDLRLLSVDNKVVLPIDTNIRLQITARDVIHSWGVPALGIKVDAIPGRLNEAWFNVKNPGIYYGQCYELCGQGHGFMPIVIETVNKKDFDQWIENKKLIS